MAHDREVFELADRVRDLVPAGVRSGARRIDGVHVSTMFDVERRRIAGAVAARRAEFATGRSLIRDLTAVVAAVDARPDRTPAWPDGFTGSIAHDADFVVGAVTDRREIAAIGIDLEPCGAVDAETASFVVRPGDSGDPTLVFVAKEAAYKAWWVTTGASLEPGDVRITVVADGSFRAEIQDGVDRGARGGVTLAGRWTSVAGRWVACLVIHR